MINKLTSFIVLVFAVCISGCEHSKTKILLPTSITVTPAPTPSEQDAKRLADERASKAAGSYLTTTGTAADSAKLGGVAASGYSQTSHTHNYANTRRTRLVGEQLTQQYNL